MEPQLPNPLLGSESRMPNAAHEKAHFGPSSGVEKVGATEVSRESQAQAMAENQPAPSATDFAALTPPPAPVLDDSDDTQTTNLPDDGMPVVASDDDLIEKEWVEKAKNLINQTKNDPYEQEKAVSLLQAHYLQKRYNKTIKLPSDD